MVNTSFYNFFHGLLSVSPFRFKESGVFFVPARLGVARLGVTAEALLGVIADFL